MKLTGHPALYMHEQPVSRMQEAGLVIKEEPYTMRVPRSQRGGEVIEPLVREQWFVRMQPLAEPALKVTHLTIAHILCGQSCGPSGRDLGCGYWIAGALALMPLWLET